MREDHLHQNDQEHKAVSSFIHNIVIAITIFIVEVCNYMLTVHTLTDSQPQTQRECPNCGESCHIRYKSCPHSEHLFPSSSKSRAKPNQEPNKNPANLLQIIQKKVSLSIDHIGF